jgi:predicted RND superfamily exporter protein
MGRPRVSRAVRKTLETTGTATLFAAAPPGVGFAIFTLASMQNAVEIGLLCTFAIAIAHLADVTLAPALMIPMTCDRRSSPHRDAGAVAV